MTQYQRKGKLTIILISLGCCIIIYNFLNLKKKPNSKVEVDIDLDLVGNLTEEEVASGELRLAQDDPRIIKYIKTHHLIAPPLPNTVETDKTPSSGVNYQEQQEIYRYVLNLLKNQVGGFFIECGAQDGEYYSNTMPLERYQNWTGLLIEADPNPYSGLVKRNRYAWLSNSCLSPSNWPKKISFKRSGGLTFIPGYLLSAGPLTDKDEMISAHCFPLHSILKAVGVTTIDYFSLDIEGAELDVLKTIPWDKVLIRALSIEVSPQLANPVKEFMTSLGYKYMTYIKNGYSHDQIYAHPTLNIA